MSDRTAQARSFGAAAAAYERGRPSYPAQAIEWLVPTGARRALDLGAGTGKLTRQLSERSVDVVAVEPSAGMREQLTHALPSIPALAGSAEDIPLTDHSVDVVVVAQAWHWVDPDRAIPEIARVLTPGGQLSLVWNTRDEREDWVAQLGRLLHPHGVPPTSGVGVDAITAPFGTVEHHTVHWRNRLTPAELLDLVASRSYVITLPSSDRSALLAEVHCLLAEHPALAGRDEMVMPYVTHCFRTRLTSSE
ncbi:class I SAM-dependent methyltransferase [Streptomyces sp. H39-S7]|uniref:class I SAM-dependent methyltransferase n=1 Tax=Streptomyces sp. H39-S7 TaxID=3004357 RepID=UPI0022AFA7A3|nr:class I SAM-dependent methyltransferase [Streptomyces sp. H39-S7]MCZ4124644.1 class I SAM-dependent methyltransferase [Streptomyces sp. H39-S7]